MNKFIPWNKGRLTVSDNGRYFQHEDGSPFFWQADTAWLISRLHQEEVKSYLRDRQQKGYNVIQIMGVHSLSGTNGYGRSPFLEQDFTRPDVTTDPNGTYSYWDHMDYIIQTAAEFGMYVALVPVWGSIVVHTDALDSHKAAIYGKWIAERYKDEPNIIWFIGGDERGNIKMDVWLSLANTIRETDSAHLMTYHPFGRTQSSTWFHQEHWLDFNMFQSGHRRYDQLQEDSPATWKGEDNWRYVQEDYARYPAKPTLDGEPSYEGIPHGLHNKNEPFWTAADCRRYAYWSVFAGACGHTYGHSAVMQMHKPEYGEGAYGVKKYWQDALDDEAAGQMQYLSQLMLSRPYFERTPDQTVIHGDPGHRYDRLMVTRGRDYLFAYIYTGRPFKLQLGVLTGDKLQAKWFDPRSGETQALGIIDNSGIGTFHPPDGNDWVLILDDAQAV